MLRKIIIAAFDENRVIGIQGKLPWKMPDDLAYFKQQTESKPMIMGNTTFKSFPSPLQGRQHIVLSRHTQSHDHTNIVYVESYQAALDLVKNNPIVMIIGGQQVYNLALPSATDMYLTKIHGSFEGDAFFPEWDPDEWTLVSSEQFDSNAKNPYARTNYLYRRRILP